VKVVEGAGHTFSNRVGRAGVQQLIESWLNFFLPLPGCGNYTNRRETADLSTALRRDLRFEPAGR
jgi:hypothetical protein